MSDTLTTSPLYMDRDIPLGNTIGNDGRRALHVKLKNTALEPINVNATIVSGPATSAISSFNSINSVPASSTTALLTYTVPSVTKFFLHRIEVSGNNIAQFDVSIDSVQIARKRTYFGGALNEVFEFGLNNELGQTLTTGQVIQVTVIHFRPTLGDFEARLQGIST